MSAEDREPGRRKARADHRELKKDLDEGERLSHAAYHRIESGSISVPTAASKQKGEDDKPKDCTVSADNGASDKNVYEKNKPAPKQVDGGPSHSEPNTARGTSSGAVVQQLPATALPTQTPQPPHSTLPRPGISAASSATSFSATTTSLPKTSGSTAIETSTPTASFAPAVPRQSTSVFYKPDGFGTQVDLLGSAPVQASFLHQGPSPSSIWRTPQTTGAQHTALNTISSYQPIFIDFNSKHEVARKLEDLKLPIARCEVDSSHRQVDHFGRETYSKYFRQVLDYRSDLQHILGALERRTGPITPSDKLLAKMAASKTELFRDVLRITLMQIRLDEDDIAWNKKLIADPLTQQDEWEESQKTIHKAQIRLEANQKTADGLLPLLNWNAY